MCWVNWIQTPNWWPQAVPILGHIWGQRFAVVLRPSVDYSKYRPTLYPRPPLTFAVAVATEGRYLSPPWLMLPSGIDGVTDVGSEWLEGLDLWNYVPVGPHQQCACILILCLSEDMKQKEPALECLLYATMGGAIGGNGSKAYVSPRPCESMFDCERPNFRRVYERSKILNYCVV